MPQLDFGTYPAQIFWLIISFSVLYVFVVRYVVPRAVDVFERRKDAIERTLAKGETLRNETAILIDEYESKIEKARRKNQKILLKEREKTAEIVRQQTDEAMRLIANQTQKAQQGIQSSLEDAMKETGVLADQLADKVYHALVSTDGTHGPDHHSS